MVFIRYLLEIRAQVTVLFLKLIIEGTLYKRSPYFVGSFFFLVFFIFLFTISLTRKVLPIAFT